MATLFRCRKSGPLTDGRRVRPRLFSSSAALDPPVARRPTVEDDLDSRQAVRDCLFRGGSAISEDTPAHSLWGPLLLQPCSPYMRPRVHRQQARERPRQVWGRFKTLKVCLPPGPLWTSQSAQSTPQQLEGSPIHARGPRLHCRQLYSIQGPRLTRKRRPADRTAIGRASSGSS